VAQLSVPSALHPGASCTSPAQQHEVVAASTEQFGASADEGESVAGASLPASEGPPWLSGEGLPELLQATTRPRADASPRSEANKRGALMRSDESKGDAVHVSSAIRRQSMGFPASDTGAPVSRWLTLAHPQYTHCHPRGRGGGPADVRYYDTAS
jgi:hypothetical protein